VKYYSQGLTKSKTCSDTVVGSNDTDNPTTASTADIATTRRARKLMLLIINNTPLVESGILKEPDFSTSVL
jgi:hypothetical protein